MDTYKLSKDWIRENGAMIKKGFSVALAHKYDIRSKKDVLEVLKIIDPTNASEENADIFSQVLSLFEQQLKKKTEGKFKEKKREIN